jgi:prevent-host-death family protein
MKTVNVHEAKTNLSQLLAEVERGAGDVVIAGAGKPITRLIKEPPRAKKGGMAAMLKGKIEIIGDIVNPIPEIWRSTGSCLVEHLGL